MQTIYPVNSIFLRRYTAAGADYRTQAFLMIGQSAGCSSLAVTLFSHEIAVRTMKSRSS